LSVLNTNKKILLLSIARAIESFGVSFLVVVIPIYISGDQIADISMIGSSFFGLEITIELLIGVAISTAALVSSLGQPIGGSLSDRYKKRKIFVIMGLFLLAFSVPFYLVVDSYQSIIILRIVQGISGALLIPGIAAMVNIEALKDSKGESFGIYNTFRLIGFGLGPIVAGGIISYGPYDLRLVQFTGIEFAFVVTILAALISLFLVILFVEESSIDEDAQKKDVPIMEVIKTSKFKYIIVLAGTNFLLAASIAVFVTLEGPVMERFDQTTFMFGLQFSAAIIANTISQTPVGRISDRRGRKKFILLGFLILIPSITIQGFVNSSYQMLVARLIQGVSVALVFAPSLALGGELADEDKNSGLFLSVLTGSFGLGIAVGPTASGILFSLGGFSTPFIFSGIASFIGFTVVYIYLPDK
jgi:MFS family permease